MLQTLLQLQKNGNNSWGLQDLWHLKGQSTVDQWQPQRRKSSPGNKFTTGPAAGTHLPHSGASQAKVHDLLSPWPVPSLCKALCNSRPALGTTFGVFFRLLKLDFTSGLGFFDSLHYSVSPLTPWPQERAALYGQGWQKIHVGFIQSSFLSKVYEGTSFSPFWTWIIFLFSCFLLFWFPQIRKKMIFRNNWQTVDEQLSVHTLNVHMELKRNTWKQLISYSTIKCSCLPAGNSCIL